MATKKINRYNTLVDKLKKVRLDNHHHEFKEELHEISKSSSLHTLFNQYGNFIDQPLFYTTQHKSKDPCSFSVRNTNYQGIYDMWCMEKACTTDKHYSFCVTRIDGSKPYGKDRVIFSKTLDLDDKKSELNMNIQMVFRGGILYPLGLQSNSHNTTLYKRSSTLGSEGISFNLQSFKEVFEQYWIAPMVKQSQFDATNKMR